MAGERGPGPRTLEERDPEKAAELLKAFTKDGATQMSVAQETGVSRCGVQGFEDRNKSVIEDYRHKKWADLGPELRDLAFKATMKAKDNLDKAGPRDLMIAAGIAVEKGFLIEGKATQLIGVVHEHRHSVARVLQAIGEALEARQGVTTIDAQAEALDSE